MHLSMKKKQETKILTPIIDLFPIEKRSSYFPLIVSSTNLHLAALNDLKGFWRTMSSCFVFALFCLSVRCMFYA
jgi:hypothetical protein